MRTKSIWVWAVIGTSALKVPSVLTRSARQGTNQNISYIHFIIGHFDWLMETLKAEELCACTVWCVSSVLQCVCVCVHYAWCIWSVQCVCTYNVHVYFRVQPLLLFMGTLVSSVSRVDKTRHQHTQQDTQHDLWTHTHSLSQGDCTDGFIALTDSQEFLTVSFGCFSTYCLLETCSRLLLWLSDWLAVLCMFFGPCRLSGTLCAPQSFEFNSTNKKLFAILVL